MKARSTPKRGGEGGAAPAERERETPTNRVSKQLFFFLRGVWGSFAPGGPQRGYGAPSAAREAHLLPDLSLVAGRKHAQVGSQGAGVHNLGVEVGVLAAPEEDVLLQRRVLNPRLLRHVGHGALERQTAGAEPRFPPLRGLGYITPILPRE